MGVFFIFLFLNRRTYSYTELRRTVNDSKFWITHQTSHQEMVVTFEVRLAFWSLIIHSSWSKANQLSKEERKKKEERKTRSKVKNKMKNKLKESISHFFSSLAYCVLPKKKTLKMSHYCKIPWVIPVFFMYMDPQGEFKMTTLVN